MPRKRERERERMRMQPVMHYGSGSATATSGQYLFGNTNGTVIVASHCGVHKAMQCMNTPHERGSECRDWAKWIEL